MVPHVAVAFNVLSSGLAAIALPRQLSANHDKYLSDKRADLIERWGKWVYVLAATDYLKDVHLFFVVIICSMGILGLLPKLASITKPVHISSLAGLTVAVDAYVWLHRAAYSCSRELCQNIKTDRYVRYCIEQVKTLQHYKIRPVLVFDGGLLPAKKGKELERRERREHHMTQAVSFLREGNFSAANDAFQKAVNVTPHMAHCLIMVLRELGVDYLVAPYEADAQLAYLCIKYNRPNQPSLNSNYVDAVITEDSDLLTFGAPRVLFKLDNAGNAQQILLEDLEQNSELDLRSFTQANFRYMCILAGCDYVANIAGIGLKKAYWLVHRHRTPDKIMKAIRMDQSIDFPPNYPEYFRRADLAFQHQIVFDPNTLATIPLNPLPDSVDIDTMDYLGTRLEFGIGALIALGAVDPIAMTPFVTLEELKSFREVLSRDSSEYSLIVDCLKSLISSQEIPRRDVEYVKAFVAHVAPTPPAPPAPDSHRIDKYFGRSNSNTFKSTAATSLPASGPSSPLRKIIAIPTVRTSIVPSQPPISPPTTPSSTVVSPSHPKANTISPSKSTSENTPKRQLVSRFWKSPTKEFPGELQAPVLAESTRSLNSFDDIPRVLSYSSHESSPQLDHKAALRAISVKEEILVELPQSADSDCFESSDPGSPRAGQKRSLEPTAPSSPYKHTPYKRARTLDYYSPSKSFSSSLVTTGRLTCRTVDVIEIDDDF